MSKALKNAQTLRRSSTDADPGYTGIWPDVTTGTGLTRTRDRLFVNGGAAFTGNRSGTQGGFVPTSAEGANWAPRDSMVFSATDKGLMALTGFASNEFMDLTIGEPEETVGASGFVIGKQPGRSVWGLYSDVQYHAGISGWGGEIAVKNVSGVDTTATPYYIVSGACGLWFPAGGDASYGGAPTHPSNYALGIGANSSTWNKGMIFFHNGLTRTSGYGTAIEMAEKHRIIWRTATNGVGFDVRSEVTSITGNMGVVAYNSNVTISGPSGASVAVFSAQASGVNYLQIANQATGSNAYILAAGSDPDRDVQLQGKGTGGVRLMDGAAALKFALNTTGIGFFGTAPVAKPTGVAVTAAGVHAALVTLGLIAP